MAKFIENFGDLFFPSMDQYFLIGWRHFSVISKTPGSYWLSYFWKVASQVVGIQ